MCRWRDREGHGLWGFFLSLTAVVLRCAISRGLSNQDQFSHCFLTGSHSVKEEKVGFQTNLTAPLRRGSREPSCMQLVQLPVSTTCVPASSHMVHSLGCLGHKVSVPATQLSRRSQRIAINNTQLNYIGCVPVKL